MARPALASARVAGAGAVSQPARPIATAAMLAVTMMRMSLSSRAAPPPAQVSSQCNGLGGEGFLIPHEQRSVGSRARIERPAVPLEMGERRRIVDPLVADE